MRPGILPEHCFKHKGNQYATLPWFGTKIAQKYAKRIKTKTWSTEVFVVKRHILTFSTSGQRQVTTCCTCAVKSRKKCHVSGCRHRAGDVCCLRCLINRSKPTNDWWQTLHESFSKYHHDLTDQSRFMDQPYNIVDWQILFTWLWRWLPLRLSKRQSPTTVLFRTTLTQAITQYELLILLGSNHLLNCYIAMFLHY